MEVFSSKKKGGKELVRVRAYRGDAMTLLCFDVDQSILAGLAGFTIEFETAIGKSFIYNRLRFPDAFLSANPQIPRGDRNSTLYSPIQRFSWVHVPSVGDGDQVVFGKYTYRITPRHIVAGKLADLDETLTVEFEIEVDAFTDGKVDVGFTRGFMSSTSYVKRFGLENKKIRPNETDLLFDVSKKSGTAKRWDNVSRSEQPVDYTFEEQHRWLGWQARARILEFLDEAIADPDIVLKVFAYDLDEPVICAKLLKLAVEDRLRIILDNSSTHVGPTAFEDMFAAEFAGLPGNPANFARGKFGALAHSKVFIHVRNGIATMVLTGSTNFSTNGLYINSNHVVVFRSRKVAKLYEEVFESSFGAKMVSFKGSAHSTTDYAFSGPGLPKFTVTFAPHPKADAQRIFDRISQRIESAGSDVLFAIMKDTSASSILDSVKKMVRSSNVYTYGITDTIGKTNADYGVFLYKPNSKRAVRVAAKGISNILPPPLGEVPKISGYAIHHKFVVVDFKGPDPTVYCGSSNLAFGPEQRNGDNLLEIHDRDIATVFAIEAFRLVEHFQWRNKELKADRMTLDDLTDPSDLWYTKYFDSADLRNLERLKFIAPS